jgi:[NiFe] hydrogenase diaphorase moiety small subunit
VRASTEVDGKQVFALAGRGMGKHLVVNSPSGLLRDSAIAVTDQAAQVCPVGVILSKRVGFATPVGQRRFDQRPISAQASDFAPRAPGTRGS